MPTHKCIQNSHFLVVRKDFVPIHRRRPFVKVFYVYKHFSKIVYKEEESMTGYSAA
jgi:hypothetical protein